jgi:hypothetical protein
MTPTRTRKPTLMQRLTTICEQHGWQVGRVRVLSSESQPNTGKTTARMNAVAVWRGARVEHLGMIKDVKGWSNAQIEAKLKELESRDASAEQTMC